ncbi:MAG TPA: GAF domain-containing protein [Salinivirgaceae bacterium]|nr:GAF domain-containing protein [Salinivirgaceae bacterium]
MDKIKKYRKQISFLILLSAITLLTGVIIVGSQYVIDFELMLPQIVALLFLCLIYFKVRQIYHHTKEILTKIEEENRPENITFEKVLNPQPETSEEKIQENKDRFNHLVEQFKSLKSPQEIAQSFLSRMAKEFEIVQGLFYIYEPDQDEYVPIAEYAFYGNEKPSSFKISEGLNGQVVRDRKVLYISQLPDEYRKIVSGLGNREPNYLLIIPVVNENKVVALTELALFRNLDKDQIVILEKILNQLSGCFEK